MRKKGALFFALFLLVLMLAGGVLIFAFAWQSGINACVKAIVGFVCGVVFAPILHELGHILFAKLKNMQIQYVKTFCFQWHRKGGKLRFSFASPFSDDQTQAIPKSCGDMQRRFVFYSLGGLIVEGAFFAAVTAIALICTFTGATNYLFWGLVPYTAYLFLLNVVPLEYGSGKTDTRICCDVKKGESVAQAMITAMEIQGRLYAGQTFSEIDEKLYNSFPVLCEDEPMFALILQLKYKMYLDKEDHDKAAECLNRLARVQEFLSVAQVQELAAELVYLHALNGNQQGAEESAKYCELYLKSDEITAKRALAAYCKAFGKEDAVSPLIEQARDILSCERIIGLVKSEEKLLNKLAE